MIWFLIVPDKLDNDDISKELLKVGKGAGGSEALAGVLGSIKKPGSEEYALIIPQNGRIFVNNKDTNKLKSVLKKLQPDGDTKVIELIDEGSGFVTLMELFSLFTLRTKQEMDALGWFDFPT